MLLQTYLSCTLFCTRQKKIFVFKYLIWLCKAKKKNRMKSLLLLMKKEALRKPTQFLDCTTSSFIEQNVMKTFIWNKLRRLNDVILLNSSKLKSYYCWTPISSGHASLRKRRWLHPIPLECHAYNLNCKTLAVHTRKERWCHLKPGDNFSPKQLCKAISRSKFNWKLTLNSWDHLHSIIYSLISLSTAVPLFLQPIVEVL